MKKILTAFAMLIGCSALFAEGYYLEFKLSSADGKEGYSGDMKVFAQDQNSRMEMKVQVKGMGDMEITTLSLKSNPNTVYMLDTKNKTYSELSVESDDYKDYPLNEYEVTVIGKEKVNGYNTTHVKVKVKGQKVAQEIWTSTEIPEFEKYAGNMKSKYWGRDNMYKALQAKGAAGFPVRMKVEEQGGSMQLDLVKAEKRNVAAEMLSLNGYSKAAGAGVPGGIDVQEMMKNLQNMTPAEREQMLEQLKQQYGNPK